MRTIVLILPMFLLAARALAQDTTRTLAAGYIANLDTLLSLRINANDHIESFALPINGQEARIAQNTALKSTLTVNYRILALSVSHAPGFIEGNRDDARKGRTETGGLGIDLNFARWTTGLHYSWTYGYYLDNTADFNPGWDPLSDPYVQFNDLYYQSWAGFLSYKADPRLSLKALTVQSERQLRSAGSFIPLFTYRYYIVDDRTALTGTNSSQRSRNLELIAGPGYYHTFVLHRAVYLGAGAYLGAGRIWTALETRTPAGILNSEQANGILRGLGDLGIGYNGTRLFAGGYLRFARARYDQEGSGVVVTNDEFTYQVFLGYRLDPPDILRKGVDKVDQLPGW